MTANLNKEEEEEVGEKSGSRLDHLSVLMLRDRRRRRRRRRSGERQRLTVVVVVVNVGNNRWKPLFCQQIGEEKIQKHSTRLDVWYIRASIESAPVDLIRIKQPCGQELSFLLNSKL